MKKFLCVLISALLITCCFAVNCFAAKDGEINGAAVYAAPGSTVELPVKYVNNPGFWIMFLEVNFDPDVFEFDLRLTKDEKLIILHDETLDEITDAVEYFGKTENYPASPLSLISIL